MIRLLLLSAFAVGFSATAAAQESDDARRDATLADIRAMVEGAEGDTALVVAVTDRDRMLMVASHGLADVDRRIPAAPDTRFAIGSISKSFTAVALMQMADDGRFDPDAPIARYLPDFRVRSDFAPITGGALMSHTSGLPNYLAHVASMRFLVTALQDFEPRYAPGAHFWYSNSGYQLLGYAAEAVDKAPFPLILQRRILDPLGMASTAPQIDDRLRRKMATSYARAPNGDLVVAPWFEHLAADGAIVSTAPDMTAYARMLLTRGNSPQRRILSERAFARLITPVRDDYGFGFDIGERGQMLFHTGSIMGFQAYFAVHLQQGLGIVILGNGPADRTLRERIVARLFNIAPHQLPDLQWRGTEGFAGRFVGRGGRALLFRRGPSGDLLVDDGGGTLMLARIAREAWGAHLTPAGPRAFLFFRDASGAVSEVVEGDATYARENAALSADPPTGYRPLVGRYAAHGEEGPSVRIYARGAQLTMSYADSSLAMPLVEDGPGRFRFETPIYAPEWLQFDTVVEGKAERLVLNGVPLYRIDLP
ncbi:serine hydrolase domain-containing protein [Sphingopyxis sp. RIFCSPHIGHO2_12_FULL_65_19]|uniref:serine hydrolase domain-containing protein n=1 Tax=Sphingopyxis sp. RIFCSPHIGHO2_12_FULL_65_19 TaxID=1802172 RepID=UPI000B134AA8|nr:serine hydrolase domain-containing protein [Sphingopyxis sp. RIFCSPHIGHO2_12_FULL_65_19]